MKALCISQSTTLILRNVFVLVLFKCCSVLTVQSQVYLGAKSGYLNTFHSSEQFCFGIVMDVEIYDRWSAHYSIMAGNNYIQMPLGPHLGVLAGREILASSAPDSATIGESIKYFFFKPVGAIMIFSLLSLLPEGVSYNLPLSEKLTFSPYISPLQAEFMNKKDNKWIIASELGIGLQFNQKGLRGNTTRISPYVGYRIRYLKNFRNPLSAGIALKFDI